MSSFFAASNNVASSSLRATPTDKVEPVDLRALQNASQCLNEQTAKDAQLIPDLAETLSAQGSVASSFYTPFADVHVPFSKRTIINLPDGLFTYFSTAAVNTKMGIMPEIERVWISIDHKLFLWDYVEGQEISSFVDQPSVISHVAIVKPKKGLFIDDISHLLVICTPLSVLLIAVSVTPAAMSNNKTRKEIKLYATDLTIPTEVEMSSVVGTEDGRIFMCGAQDGNLYELHYQENESWFGKRIQLINHSVGGVQSFLPRFVVSSSEDRIISITMDNARHCFYTLSEKNTINVYKPTTERSVQHVQTLSNLYKAALDKTPGAPALSVKAFTIISVFPIHPSESQSGVQLLAITSNAVRLYFGISSGYGYSYNAMSSAGTRPLQLVHVRLPPPNLLHPDEQKALRPPVGDPYSSTNSISPRQPRGFVMSDIHTAYYADGMTFAVQTGDREGFDLLLSMAPDLTKIGVLDQLNLNMQPQQQQYSMTVVNPNQRLPMTERASLIPIIGRTWAIAPVPRTLVSSTPSGVPRPVATNELATQFGEISPYFLILTPDGITVMAKRRSVDHLVAVIEDLQMTGSVAPMIEFRDSYGRNQTCAMLLALACGNTFLEASEESTGYTVPKLSPETASVARQAYYDFGEQPKWTEKAVYGHPENKGSTEFSGRREGLALYFARLIRPIWKSKLTKLSPTGQHEIETGDKTLLIIQKNLYMLKEFFDVNPQLFHSSTGDTASRISAMEQEAWKAEQASAAEILSLLTRTIEALSFVLLLNDYKIGELVTHCEADIQKQIGTLTYEELVVSPQGMSISRALVNVIIDQQIGQQISVDTISEVLQHRCGSFCSTDDVMLYKAKESVRKATETRSIPEKQILLSEALRLYVKGARILELERLREIVGDFQQLQYAKGAVELPLICAQSFDPINTGVEYWLSGMPPGDTRQSLYEHRQCCYELILDSLMAFEGTESKHSSEAESVQTHAYELAFASNDEMFQSTLYDWLIGRQLADDLLEIRPAFLEAHLRREPVTLEKYQLLWQYYVKDNQHLRAAEVLANMAESTTFDVNLAKRLEYLTLAVGNAKSHPISAGGRHESAIAFLTDLEEKLEVAQVQLEIYNVLAPHMSDAPEVAQRVELLWNRLFTLSDLFQEYAIPFDLPKLKLLCLYVSDHQDESMLRSIWNQIFEQAMSGADEPIGQSDQIEGAMVSLGQRYYPSESAFPLRLIAGILVRFLLENKAVVKSGWACRTLINCGVPYIEIWELLHEMYESHVPPFNSQENVQCISTEIAMLISDWIDAAKRPNSKVSRGEFPVGRLDLAVDHYLQELDPKRDISKKTYERIKRELRKNF